MLMFKKKIRNLNFYFLKNFNFSTESQKISLLFPGQGCQFVGMINDYTSNLKYQNIIESFDNTLFKLINLKISHIMSFKKGESDEEIKRKARILHLTEISQPAILLLSILNLKNLLEEKIFLTNEVKYVFGPSLGEIISLVAADSLSLNEAGEMLYYRGKYMQESCPKGEGSMLNVIGDIEITTNLFQKFLITVEEKEYINISSIHSKRLLVLSGKNSLIQKCSQFFKEKNIPNKQLNVSAAFHSKLMEKGKLQFDKYLEKIKFNDPKYKIISTVTGRVIEETKNFDELIKEILVRQFCEPIRLLPCYQICTGENVKILDVVKRKYLDDKEII